MTEMIPLSVSEARKAFHYYLTMRGAPKDALHDLTQEEAFWQFLGTSIKALREIKGTLPFTTNVLIPEEVANKIKMLNGPHQKAMFRAMEANK